MHLILALLGAIITVLILVKRLSDAGIDISSFNPFAWKRRKDWSNRINLKPIYAIEEPMAMAALLLTTAAKIDGDMSLEEKTAILTLFEEEFNLSEKDAADLLRASVFILEDGAEVRSNLSKVFAPNLSKFSESQARSVLEMIGKVSGLDRNERVEKKDFSSQVEMIFEENFRPKGKWD